MKKVKISLMWFLGIYSVVKLILQDQSLGYFWFVVIGLSIFFGLHTTKKIKITDDMSQQVITWLKKYQELSYSDKNIYLNEIINRAMKSNNQKDAHKFLETVTDAEPDNELAKGLLISMWGTGILYGTLSDNT